MSVFGKWSIADVHLHNAVVSKENRIEHQESSDQGLEAELHDSIYSECRRRGWIAFHGSMAERTHRTLGEPDFIILCDGGRKLLVECKSAKGKLSVAQLSILEHARHLGHRVDVVRSMSEFLIVCDSVVR